MLVYSLIGIFATYCILFRRPIARTEIRKLSFFVNDDLIGLSTRERISPTAHGCKRSIFLFRTRGLQMINPRGTSKVMGEDSQAGLS